MKILILHQHFKTPQGGGAIRSYYLTKALVERGHRVAVITTSNERSFRIENLEGVEVFYLPIAYDNRFGFFKRGWAFIQYIFKSAKLSRQFRDFDICYAISVPLTVGIVARWNKFRFGLPYIFEVGDLWPDAPIQMGFVRNYFLKKVLLALEKSIYFHAREIVALSQPIQVAIAGKISEKKIHCIPNMADCDFYQPQVKEPHLEKKYNVSGKFVIAYLGALGVANGLEYYLECADASRKANQPVHFIICGDGATREKLIAGVLEKQLENVTILPFVNRDGIREIMNITDAAFICYKNVPILETGSPNKYFDALASGKLIIVNFGGWIKKEIEMTQCGLSLNPLDPLDLVEKIKSFISDPTLLKSHQHAARELAERKYSRKLLSETFAKLF